MQSTRESSIDLTSQSGVGDGVGTDVGLPVGLAVGLDVGLAVGDGVGRGVGAPGAPPVSPRALRIAELELRLRVVAPRSQALLRLSIPEDVHNNESSIMA